MRLIKQLADAVARMAGYNRRHEYDRALREADRAWEDLIDVPRAMVDVVDTPTLAAMLRDADKIRLASQIVAEQARALAGTGDPVTAALRFARAMELRLEARALAPVDDDGAALLELSRHVHANQLDARYRGER